MSKKSDLYGISKFEIGAPGDGIMGTVLEEFNDIVEGTVQFTLPKSESIKIFSETNRKTPYKVIDGGTKDSPKVVVNLLGVDIDKWTTFLGGSYNGTTKKWTIAKDSEQNYKSVKITTKETSEDGDYLVIEIPFALVTAGIEGALTFNNIANISITAEAMVPVSNSGVEGDAISISLVSGDKVVTFVVKENTTAIPFAVVNVSNKILITDENGSATIDLPNGAYSYTVNAAGYDEETGTATVNGSNLTVNVAIAKTT